MAPLLSRLEVLALLALARLGDDAYGVTVQATITAATGREVSMAAVYVAIERLEKQGLTKSRQSEPRPERGGRSRRHHALTAAGKAALRHEQAVMAEMWRGVSLKPEAKRR